LTARIIERAMGAEMDDHLGYENGDPARRGTGNSRTAITVEGDQGILCH
jgi:transposase-like protein